MTKAIVVYLLFLISALIAFLEFIFFVLFLISYIHQKNLTTTIEYSYKFDKWDEYITGIVAFEFLMFFFGIGQLIFFILAFKCQKHLLYFSLNICSLFCFFVFWIGSIILFCKSHEYKFIKDANFQKQIYSWNSYLEQMKQWSKQNPILRLRAIGSTRNKICSGDIKINKTQSERYSFDESEINFKDISGDSLAIINIEIDIKWNSEINMKLLSIDDEIKKCTELKSLKAHISKFESLDKIPKIIIVSKNGKIPRKFKKSMALARAIFGLGLDVITDLSTIPVFTRKIMIHDSSFNYSFDCSQFEYDCIHVPTEEEIYNNTIESNYNKDYKHTSIKLIQKKFNFLMKKKTKSISRNILCRSYYLSESAYSGVFDYYGVSFRSSQFKSGSLMQIINSNTNNGYLKPCWYAGTHENVFYVTIKGSDMPDDYSTDATIKTEFDNKNSFHKGFYCAAKYVWGEISSDIKEYNKQGYTIIFTGHSYGGSVAQILHFIASNNNIDNIYSITFGTATPMGPTPAKQIANNCFTFVNKDDIIPRIMKFVTDIKNDWGSRVERFWMAYTEHYWTYYEYCNNWEITGYEDIIDPVGIIYHLPALPSDKSKRKSIESTIKKINEDFYNNDNLNIKDHHLFSYYNNMLYDDGIISPSNF